MMKRSCGILLMGLALAGCKSNTEAVSAAEPATPDTVVVIVQKSLPQGDSLAISFEKTPCFGKCPVYKIKVYESGFATYEGINFSEKLGLYSTRLSIAKMERVYQSALEIGFFELAAVYDNPQVSDLPATRTRIQMNGKEHAVEARHNAPEKLQIFQENLAVSLGENDWKPYSNR